MHRFFNFQQYSSVQMDLFCVAVASLVCSLILIMTYRISPTWRNEFTASKNIILIISVYSLLHCIILLDLDVDKPPAACAIQFALIQVRLYLNIAI